MLLKAVIWRESAFQSDMVGKDGERGLMQVMEGAAKDWAKSQKVDDLKLADLFDPKTNIEVGAWYAQPLPAQHYSGKDDPIPFALAEYNAGRQRMNRWIGENHNLSTPTAQSIPGSHHLPQYEKLYVQAILSRYSFTTNPSAHVTRPPQPAAQLAPSSWLDPYSPISTSILIQASFLTGSRVIINRASNAAAPSECHQPNTKISVIVPTFNAALFISISSAGSVQQQNF